MLKHRRGLICDTFIAFGMAVFFVANCIAYVFFAYVFLT